MNIRLALITFFLYAFSASCIYIVPIWLQDHAPIRASILPREIFVNEKIQFKDSTIDASRFLWEFGNGERSRKQKGTYAFRKEGTYLVQLTVDDQLKDTFLVHVKKKPVAIRKDSTVGIEADNFGIVGQKIHFKAVGSDIERCEWYFGETGKITSREYETFHSYANSGVYYVKLFTNLNPMKPIIHLVKIFPLSKPKNAVIPPPPPAAGAGKPVDKLKLGIQEIANGSSFVQHYNAVLKGFLCSNPSTPVVVNSKPKIDFYSYCHSLQMSSGITIDQVVPEIDQTTHCTKKLVITQH
jgi:hypothetical protein